MSMMEESPLPRNVGATREEGGGRSPRGASVKHVICRYICVYVCVCVRGVLAKG